MNHKYIYFEIRSIAGSNPTPKTMQHENILVLKPHTNSEGIWSFRHITERTGLNQHLVVDQYWIDLEKYVFEKSKDIDDLVNECLLKFKNPDAEKIKKILEEIFSDYSNSEDIEDVEITEKEISFNIYDRNYDGLFNNTLSIVDGEVICSGLHEIWESGDVRRQIEKKLTKFLNEKEEKNSCC